MFNLFENDPKLISKYDLAQAPDIFKYVSIKYFFFHIELQTSSMGPMEDDID